MPLNLRNDNDPRTVWVQEDQTAPQAAAGKERNWLMSEQTLNQQLVQRLEFAKDLQAERHLFHEVCHKVFR